MRIRLKALREQTVVITGATSGVGLAVARKAAAQGARLVLAARNDDVLADLVTEIEALGGAAVAVTADVGNEADVRRIADAAMDRFGGFDSWINNAGVSIYGALEEVSLADHRRLFDTNYWGVVHGSLIAAPHLRRHGGALINIGSVLSDRAMPVQGAYSASKHAVKGFTDALRMELEQDQAPVSVTLIKPSALDTPYKDHARNYLSVAPRNPPPVYAAELAAEAILHATQHPIRDLVVGGGGRLLGLAGQMAPKLTDRLMEKRISRLHRTRLPPRPRQQNSLYAANTDGAEHSAYPAEHSAYPMVLRRSAYTRAATHPALSWSLAVGAGLALAWFTRERTAGKHGPDD